MGLSASTRGDGDGSGLSDGQSAVTEGVDTGGRAVGDENVRLNSGGVGVSSRSNGGSGGSNGDSRELHF